MTALPIADLPTAILPTADRLLMVDRLLTEDLLPGILPMAARLRTPMVLLPTDRKEMAPSHSKKSPHFLQEQEQESDRPYAQDDSSSSSGNKNRKTIN
jgi:hypothetical protein